MRSGSVFACEPRTTEVVWLANGDRLAGEFLGLDERKIKIQVEGKPVEVDRSEVRAVGFNPGLVEYPRPKSSFLELTLKDGTRLGLADAKLEDASIAGTTRFGQASGFRSMSWRKCTPGTRGSSISPSASRLSVQYRSYVGPTREYRLDRTVDGLLFQLGRPVL